MEHFLYRWHPCVVSDKLVSKFLNILNILTVLLKITDMGQNFLNMLNLVFANYIDMKGLWSVLRGHRLFLSTSSFCWFSNLGPSGTEQYLLLPWCWTVLPWRSSCWLWLMPFAEQLPYLSPLLGTLLYVPWQLLNGYSCYLFHEKSAKRLDSLTSRFLLNVIL